LNAGDTNCLKRFLVFAVVLIAFSCNADIPENKLRDTLRNGQSLITAEIESQATNAFDALTRMAREYDSQHPADLWINTLSFKELKSLATVRTNELVPRLFLLQRELADDSDCDEWYATLRESWALSTNAEQRVVCLSLSMTSTFLLEQEKFGRPMLRQMETWLKQITSNSSNGPVLAAKIQYLRLFVALGLQDDANVALLAKGTAFQTLEPLWLMSKGQWERALEAVKRVKQLRDLGKEESNMLNAFESVLKGILEKKPAKEDKQ
jgi:hypothetical protein